jgi:hypothetical protein
VKYYGLISINSLILFGIRKKYLINGRSSLLCQFTKKVITVELSWDITDINLIQNCIKYPPLKVKSTHGWNYWDHQCGLRYNRSTIDEIFWVHQILEKKWEYSETVHQVFLDLKKAYDSVRREVLYSILIEFGVPMKLVRPIKMCLNETYSKVCIGKHLSESFLSKMV